MTRLTWTTETPTKPGWYWCRWTNKPPYGPEIIEVWEPNGPDSDYLEVNGYHIDTYVKNYGPVEWQGPLEPEEG